MLTHHTAAHQSLGSMQGRTEHEVSMHGLKVAVSMCSQQLPCTSMMRGRNSFMGHTIEG